MQVPKGKTGDTVSSTGLGSKDLYENRVLNKPRTLKKQTTF